MTYKTFKNVLRGMLTGDNVIPTDEDVMLALLEYGFTTVATKADSLRLMSAGTATEVLRLSQDGQLIRFPRLPAMDEDELDIDKELCYPTAHYIAANLSKEKAAMHISAADREISDYNAKVWEMMDTIQRGMEASVDAEALATGRERLWGA